MDVVRGSFENRKGRKIVRWARKAVADKAAGGEERDK